MEHRIRPADIADRPEVSKRKAVKVLGFVAYRSKGKSTVAQAQTAAVPVINRLNPGILQRAIDEIVPSVRRQVKSAGIGLPDFDKWLQLLTLNQRGGAPLLIDGVEKSMANSYGRRSPAVAGKNVIRVEASTFRVVVQVPLEAQVFDRFKAQSRDKRGEIPRAGQKSNSGQIKRRVEDVCGLR